MEPQATRDNVPIVVFDAVVFVQAVLSRTGPAYAAVLACAEGQAALFSCDNVETEVRDVLNRPFIRSRFPYDWTDRVNGVMNLFRDAATLVADPPVAFRLPRDPKDEPYVNLAIAVGARYLVSRDKDLLGLMTNDAPEAAEFRASYPHISVLDPASFMKALAG